MTSLRCFLLLLCVYGLNFKHLEAEDVYCDIKRWARSGNTILSCIDEEHGFARQCWILQENYQELVECKDGIFTTVDRTLLEYVVEQCELPGEPTDCPYTAQELSDFYTMQQLSLERSLTEDELAAKALLEEEMSLDTETQLRESQCPTRLCCRNSNGGYLYPRYCKNLANEQWRNICYNCRRANCGSVSGYFSSSSSNSACG